MKIGWKHMDKLEIKVTHDEEMICKFTDQQPHPRCTLNFFVGGGILCGGTATERENCPFWKML